MGSPRAWVLDGKLTTFHYKISCYKRHAESLCGLLWTR